jgi:hypothetical protein
MKKSQIAKLTTASKIFRSKPRSGVRLWTVITLSIICAVYRGSRRNKKARKAAKAVIKTIK